MFSLPLGAWDGLLYFIVALPEHSINYFKIVLVFMKKFKGIYNISYNLHIAPVYLIASCTNGLQCMHSVLHRNKKKRHFG